MKPRIPVFGRLTMLRKPALAWIFHMETLINCLCGMKRKAHGTQKPRHINSTVEVASTAQRRDSPAQAINQGFHGVSTALPSRRASCIHARLRSLVTKPYEISGLAIFFVLFLAAYTPTAGFAADDSGLILGGSAESPVKLEVFSDFECPGCRNFFLNTIQPILKNYKDRVCVVYYEFPLPMHPHARPAARYVSAAARLGDQKKLLLLFETLFTDQEKWALDGNLEASVSKALSPEDLQKVKNIMETAGESVEKDIDRDVQIGKDRDIPGTPTIFLSYGGKREMVVMPPNQNMYNLLSWRLNGLLK